MKGNALWEETQYDEIYKENASKCIDKMCSMQQQYNILSKFLKVLVLQSQRKGQDNKLHCTVWTQCLNQLPIFGQKKENSLEGCTVEYIMSPNSWKEKPPIVASLLIIKTEWRMEKLW